MMSVFDGFKPFAEKRIAFLGGAFDPPHPGHEMLARKVLALGLTDLVLWVPSWAPPHKTAGRMCDFAHRLAMTKIAAGEIAGCEVSDIEARKCFDPSYSYKILEALQSEYPDAELKLLIGQDSLEQLHTWYCAKELAEKYSILAFPRKSAHDNAAGLQLPVDFWGERLAEKLQKSLIPGEYVEISSTNLRKALAKKANVEHIINKDVLHYIEENGLYR
jgi:nicotinate-nucleotide adenylyltransferase